MVEVAHPTKSQSVRYGPSTVTELVDESLHDPIVYPAAIMADAPQADYAADFYEFMQSDFAKGVFEKYGFTVK